MKNPGSFILLILFFSSMASAASEPEPVDWSQGQLSAHQDTFIIKQEPSRNFGRTAVEVVGLNLLVWSYDRYIRPGGGAGFRIGFNSWKENLTNGFEWDDNSFSTNQYAHPYHGSLYFNAARSNGYSFWESIPFVFAGSYGWEFFGETHHASMNDWIATSLGGTALGEIFHRLALTVRDNEARGSSRTWREIGGFVVDPVGGLNRLIDGDMNRVCPNPEGRYPKNFRSELDFGVRTVGEGYIGDADSTRAFLQFDFDYGDPFFGDMESPFDHFDLQFQLNFSDKAAIGHVAANGLLAGTFLHESKSASHILAAFHHFDYTYNSKMEYGAQSLGMGFLSRFDTGHGLELRTEVHLNAIILGGTSSDYKNFSGRDYDYGPGASVEFAASFGAEGWSFLRIKHEQAYIHAINGNQADHVLSFSQIRLNVPVTKTLGAGLEYVLDTSDRNYDNYPDVYARYPQTRLFCTWIMR